MSPFKSRIVLVLAVALPALAACGDGRHDQTLYDHRLAHPVSAEAKTAVLILEIPAAGQTLAAGDAARLTAFSLDYIKRGDGALEMIVAAPAGRTAEAEGFATGLIRKLGAAGVGADRIAARIVVDSDSIAAGSAVMRYRQWVAVLPECGRWDANSVTDPVNSNSPNFGCATQHNIGAMVSNPRDLLRPVERQPREGAVGERVITRYERGEDTTTFKVKYEGSGGKD